MSARSSLDIVHTESSCGWGGQEIRILTEMAGMTRRGHRVSVVCAPESELFPEATKRGFNAVALPLTHKSPATVWRLHRWLARNRPDVINTHSTNDSWLTALAARLPGSRIPIVRTRHISSPISRRRSTRWLYQSATAHIVTTGEALREQLIRDNGFDPGRITSVTTGVDDTVFRPGDRDAIRRSLGLSRDRFLFGIVATLRRQKGHADLLHAFAGAGIAGAQLLIVGDGPGRERIENLVDELDLGERVILVGNHHDIAPWFQALDAFVLPTHAEGMPQALIQAMLCGLPVLTTPVGSIPLAIENGSNGLLIPPQDISALAAKMQRLATDSGLRIRLGEAARRTAQERFGVEAMLDGMERVFLAVAKHP